MPPPQFAVTRKRLRVLGSGFECPQRQCGVDLYGDLLCLSLVGFRGTNALLLSLSLVVSEHPPSTTIKLYFGCHS
jgi:hypothetical protein